MASKKDEASGANGGQHPQAQDPERTAQTADRELRQAADMARQQSQLASNMLAASTEAYREIAEFSRDDLDAMMESSARLARGLQDLGWEASQFTQESVRLGLRLANNLMGCRTVEDMMAAQRDFMRESVDTMLNNSARLLNKSSQVASDAVTPINERVGHGARKQMEESGEGEPLQQPQAASKRGHEARQ